MDAKSEPRLEPPHRTTREPRVIGWVLIVVGALASASQVFSATPWQALFLAGALVALAGGLLVVDAGEHR